jgi:hypothetical protein
MSPIGDPPIAPKHTLARIGLDDAAQAQLP